MSEHHATIQWHRHQAEFTDNQYSREHTWSFDGGAEIPASASPHVVPIPYSNPVYIDPEEAFVASISSCHMLWFLAIAARQKFVVEAYTDSAVGILAQNDHGTLAMIQIRLRPQIHFAAHTSPTEEQIATLHEEAHHRCFIANSVKTEILIEPSNHTPSLER